MLTEFSWERDSLFLACAGGCAPAKSDVTVARRGFRIVEFYRCQVSTIERMEKKAY